MGDNRDVLLTTLSESFLSNSDNLRNYSTYIDVVHENQLLGTKKSCNIQNIVSEINSSLNTSKKRSEALCLLRELISQCSMEVFTQNGISWLRLLTQALKSHDPAATIELTCQLISEILGHTVSFPELSRDVASSIIPSLIPVLLDNEQNKSAAFTCLTACMSHYRGASGPFKNKIEAKVVPLLDGSHEDLEDVACECYALLASCGGGGSQGVKHAEAWSVLSQRLVGSLNDTLTALLQAVQMGVEDTPVPAHRLVLVPVPEVEPSRTCRIHTRFTSLIKALNTMLSTRYMTTIKVPVEDILQVICRALSVTPKQIMFHATQERVLLCSLLPLLQAKAFSLLRSLIHSCNTNLIAYSSMISKIFIQTLNWSSPPESQYGHEKPYSGLKLELYLSLCSWVQVVGASSGLENVMSDLLTHWIKDITPQVDSVKLDSRMSQKVDILMAGGGKKRRKHGGGDVGQLTGQRKVIDGANQATCTAALQAMKQIILSLGPFLKAKHHKTLHSLLVPLLLDINQGVQNSQGCPPLPYTNAHCRLALYQLLLALVLCPHSSCPPPVQCAIRLFTLGLRDSDLSVSSSCSESLAITEALIHPRAPLLSSPPENIHDTSQQQAPSSASFGFGFYNNGPFVSGPVFSMASQRKDAQPSTVRVSPDIQAITQAAGTSKMADKQDVEVVSLGSSDSEGEKEDDEEIEEEGSVNEGTEEVIAIDDDSNSDSPSGPSSPPVPTSGLTSPPSTSARTKQPDDVVITSPQAADTGDCLIVSADTAVTAEHSEKAPETDDQNDCVVDVEVVSEGDGEGTSDTNPLTKKRKYEDVAENGQTEPSKSNKVIDNDTEAMLAAFVDAGPDSE